MTSDFAALQHPKTTLPIFALNLKNLLCANFQTNWPASHQHDLVGGFDSRLRKQQEIQANVRRH